MDTYLSEEQMDAADIPRDPDHTGQDRDQGQLNHQRATLINHDETLQRYQAYINQGLDF